MITTSIDTDRSESALPHRGGGSPVDRQRRAQRIRQALLAVTLLAGTVIGNTEMGFEFMSIPGILLGFAALGGIVLCFFLIAVRICQKRRAAAEGYAMYLLALIIGMSVSSRIHHHCAVNAKERAAPIIEALAEYHLQMGYYPESLSVLVPRYMPEPPAAPVSLLQDRPFDYSRDDESDNYYLGFPAHGGYGHSYSPESDYDPDSWSMHD